MEVARFLLSRGADRKVKNQMGLDADEIAERMGLDKWDREGGGDGEGCGS